MTRTKSRTEQPPMVLRTRPALEMDDEQLFESNGGFMLPNGAESGKQRDGALFAKRTYRFRYHLPDPFTFGREESHHQVSRISVQDQTSGFPATGGTRRLLVRLRGGPGGETSE
jgi:hypothetical protein